MKKLLVLSVFLSSTAFAGSFLKIDKGTASWNLDVSKKTGTISLTRYSAGTEGKNLTSDEQTKLFHALGWSSGLGTISNLAVSFENTDERSQETVIELIKEKMIGEMNKLKTEVKVADINIKNLVCEESGFIKKKLSCHGEYVSKLDVEFK